MLSMIQFHQLLILSLILNDSLAQVSSCRNDMDCITTFSLIEKDCILTLISSIPFDFASSPKHSKLLERMKSEQVETPQCYISSKGTNGKSKPGEFFISCHCSKTFYSGCMSNSAMAEAIYQLKRDPASVVEYNKDSATELSSKTNCVLNGFGSIHKGTNMKLKRRRPEEFHWKISCKRKTIEKTGFKKLNIEPLPKNTRVAVDLHCDATNSEKVYPRVYCSEDYCYQKSVNVFESSLIALKTLTLIQKSINKGSYVQPAEGCKLKSARDTQCTMMGFRKLVDELVMKNSTKVRSPLSLKEIGESRLRMKTNENLEEITSNNHIYSWVFFCLYFIPFISIFFAAVCSCGNVYRTELGHFANPSLKDIESTLVTDMRKHAESNVSLKKKTSKPKSEIIDVALTTTSQIHNTDLGSEGPTGPTGPSGLSSKTIKKETLKSGEDTKDSTGDVPV